MIPSEDNKYGGLSGNGTWWGQIGSLHRKEIDLSIMDLSILHDRAQV